MQFTSTRNKPQGIIRRFFRIVLSVIVLSTFVYGIAFGVRSAAAVDSNSLTLIARRLGIGEQVAGQVAGEFVQRLEETGIQDTSGEKESILATSTRKVALTIALVADSGNDYESLAVATSDIQLRNVDVVFHLGDLSDWGDTESLLKTRKVLEDMNIPWYAIPGDHDLAASIASGSTNGLENFASVFGDNYGVYKNGDVRVLYFDNSANQTPMSPDRLAWFLRIVPEVDFVVLSQPLYFPNTTDIFGKMGYFEGEAHSGLAQQASLMLDKVRASNVKAVFSADHHRTSVTDDIIRDTLRHYVVGALATSRNVQTPRYSILTVYEDLSYSVEDVIL